MRKVYEAGNGVEAHMVLHMLEQQGIQGRIDGEYLAGGVGDLPAMGLVRVMVEEPDIARAREIIAAWERKQPAVDPESAVRNSRLRTMAAILAGTFLGAGLTWVALRSPVTSEGIDYDGDGKMDETYTYSGAQLERIEVDRDADGRPDGIYHYDFRGLIKMARMDQNFDGIFETTDAYERGSLSVSSSDLEGDAGTEYQAQYVDGVVTIVEYFNPENGQLRKRVHLRHGIPVRAQLDTDNDGNLETEHTYDWIGEIVSTRRVSP